MKYGCIGEHLGHSFSKEIHNALADYEYEIREVSRGEFDGFMTEHDFSAINVTIPYKELVMPHLYFVDEHAKAIGAVNTVVNRGGRLYGYNTDFYGMAELLRHGGVSVAHKKVAVLGSGGTSKTARAVVSSLGARETVTVSRHGKEGVITYDELYKNHTDTEVIINTTPVGMYPDIFGKPVDLSVFPYLSGVIDAVYNPLRPPLVLDARERGIKAEGGLYMLVAQGVRSSEIFLGSRFDVCSLDGVYKKVAVEKENIVLIGMPTSGKSTTGEILANRLNREFVDTDVLIEKEAGISITEMIKTCGEEKFRRLESEIIKKVSGKTCAVIATGGGAILRDENIKALKENGRIYFIDRPLDALIPTADRPLSSTKEDIEKRYRERYALYTASADARIDADCTAEGVADKIMGEFLK